MRIYYYKFYNKLILILSNNVNLFYIITLNFIINLLFVLSVMSVLYIFNKTNFSLTSHFFDITRLSLA